MNDDRVVYQAQGEAVRIIIDEPMGPPRASVMMLAPFGMNSSSMFGPAYVLTRNGFRVLRLDPRNSPDGSATALLGFRMSRMQEDIELALDRLPPQGLFAMSLAVPAAVRALRSRQVPIPAGLVTPVVNVRATLLAVIGEDWFIRSQWDRETRAVKVLGHDVEVDMVRDCMKHEYETLEHTAADLSTMPGPALMVAGDRDPWVRIEEVRAAVQGTRVELLEVSAGGHLLYRNPVLAMRFFEHTVRWLAEVLCPGAEPIVVPPFSEIVSALEKGGRRRDLTPAAAPAAAQGGA